MTLRDLEEAYLGACWGVYGVVLIHLNEKDFIEIRNLMRPIIPGPGVRNGIDLSWLWNSDWFLFQGALVEVGNDLDLGVVRLWNLKGRVYDCYRN